MGGWIEAQPRGDRLDELVVGGVCHVTEVLASDVVEAEARVAIALLYCTLMATALSNSELGGCTASACQTKARVAVGSERMAEVWRGEEGEGWRAP